MKDIIIKDIIRIEGLPLFSRNEAPKILNVCQSTADSRLREFRKYNESRYKGFGFLDDGGIVRYNFIAFIDFMKYRKLLNSTIDIKFIPEFNPRAIKEAYGFYLPKSDKEGD